MKTRSTGVPPVSLIVPRAGRPCYSLLIALSVILVGCTENGNQRADKVGHTVVGQSMARGKDAVCRSNLSQIRQGLEIFRTSSEDGVGPQTLQEIRGLSADMLMDPIGKEPYEYDPATGKVKCPHPGHGKY